MANVVKILILCILYYSLGYWSCVFNFPFKKQYDGGVLYGDNVLTLKIKTPNIIPINVYQTSRINDYFIFDAR